MKLITFTHSNKTRIGVVIGDHVVDTLSQQQIPATMLEFLAGGPETLAALRDLISQKPPTLPLAQVKVHAPIPRPGKFLGVGLNYPEHIGETGRVAPEYPLFFTKQGSCIIGIHDAIHIPKVSDKVDYEGELAMVIGQHCRYVSVKDAPQMIAGYTIVNDVTVRDWQARSPTWTLGKSFDTHGPMGPWLVTADEILDPHHLNIQTWVDDELRQNADTSAMIFNCYQLLAYLSQAMTLEPGDVISTGTPSGVGVKMNPRGYLKAGQTVKIAIAGIGTLINPVIAAP